MANLINSIPLFLIFGLIGALLSSIAFGVVGTFVVAKRISYVAGAISHCVLGGLGVGLYCHNVLGIKWIGPISGAFISALMAALVIGMITLKKKEREDTIIGGLWAFGMGIGLIAMAKTPGYVDPMSYLFGNILLVGARDLWTLFIFDCLLVSGVLIFKNELLAVCFDEEFARIRGIRSDLYYLGLLCFVAVAVVLLAAMVGIVLLIAMLTLPAAIGGLRATSLWKMMIYGCVLAFIFNIVGIGLSYQLNLPTGALIVVVSSVSYFFSTLLIKKR